VKIVVTSDGPDVEAKVAHKFGTARYLSIVDLDSNRIEVVLNPNALSQKGSGIHTIVLAISKEVKAVLTGYCNPSARHQLESNGIEVLSNLSGTVKEVIQQYREGKIQRDIKIATTVEERRSIISKYTLIQSLNSSFRQFIKIMPVLIGVVLIIGLFNEFMPEDLLASIFSGNIVLDTLWGTFMGSILAGNAINSYIIGQELLTRGVSLFAVTALIISWVTIGLVQLPAEMASLGKKFALLRNALSFIMAIPIAIVMGTILNII
jgi:predicted Fe-Mo cluster-binding NifX family protein